MTPANLTFQLTLTSHNLTAIANNYKFKNSFISFKSNFENFKIAALFFKA